MHFGRQYFDAGPLPNRYVCLGEDRLLIRTHKLPQEGRTSGESYPEMSPNTYPKLRSRILLRIPNSRTCLIALNPILSKALRWVELEIAFKGIHQTVSKVASKLKVMPYQEIPEHSPTPRFRQIQAGLADSRFLFPGHSNS